jgi:hypothetical protein
MDGTSHPNCGGDCLQCKVERLELQLSEARQLLQDFVEGAGENDWMLKLDAVYDRAAAFLNRDTKA